MAPSQGERGGDRPERLWYAVSTRSRHEKVVEMGLFDQGVTTFLPVREVLSQWKDRKKRVLLPLFPGYVFTNISLPEDRLKVLKVPGVVRFISINGTPTPVPAEQIDSVQIFVREKIRFDPYPYLHEGQRVEVRRGSLKGVQGILVQKKNRFKLVLSVDLILQSISVEIDACDVEPIS